MSIELKGIAKSYGAVKAVREVTFSIPGGCLFGLLGPDGAGKTTLFRLITTLLVPEKGTITVFGRDTVNDYREIRMFTGYMPGRFSLYPDLTVEENLSFYATIFGTTIHRHYKYIEPVYGMLEPFKNRLARDLSGGMKQKLALSCALIHNPKLLVLDEPTTGVDAVSRKEFWDTLQMLKKSGMSVIVSTPYMDEATRCDRIAMMQQGAVMAEDTPEAVLGAFHKPLFEVKSENRFVLLQSLRNIPGVKRAYLFGRSVHVTLEAETADRNWLMEKLYDQGIYNPEISAIAADFEDCFIEAVDDDATDKRNHE